MTGEQVRKKIKEKGFTFHEIAGKMGVSDQLLRRLLLSDNVKSGTLERIANIMQVNVAYFYNQQPLFTLVDYAEYHTLHAENTLLKELLKEKNEVIRLLKNQK